MTLLYLVMDDFFAPELVEQATNDWPAPDWEWWFLYDNPLEKKRTLNTWSKMPQSCRLLLWKLLSLPVKQMLHLSTNPIPDLTLYGAGLNDSGRGEYLDVHLDADRHPVFGLQRIANAILFLGKRWEKHWGGELQFWSSDMKSIIKEVEPIPNRLILFLTTDQSYHGFPDPLCYPEEEHRRSLSAFWWSETVGEGKRPRSQFVARDTTRETSEVEELRKIRCTGMEGK